MPADQVVVEPKTEEIDIKGRPIGDFAAIEARLSPLQLYMSKSTANDLTLAKVESSDIQKKPFLFFIITFERERITLKYTIAPDYTPPTMDVTTGASGNWAW